MLLTSEVSNFFWRQPHRKTQIKQSYQKQRRETNLLARSVLKLKQQDAVVERPKYVSKIGSLIRLYNVDSKVKLLIIID